MEVAGRRVDRRRDMTGEGRRVDRRRGMTGEGRRAVRRRGMTGEGRKAVRRRGTRAAIRLKVVAEVVAVGRRAAETAETVGMVAETAAEMAAGAAHRTSTADCNHTAGKYQKVSKKPPRQAND